MDPSVQEKWVNWTGKRWLTGTNVVEYEEQLLNSRADRVTMIDKRLIVYFKTVCKEDLKYSQCTEILSIGGD